MCACVFCVQLCESGVVFSFQYELNTHKHTQAQGRTFKDSLTLHRIACLTFAIKVRRLFNKTFWAYSCLSLETAFMLVLSFGNITLPCSQPGSSLILSKKKVAHICLSHLLSSFCSLPLFSSFVSLSKSLSLSLSLVKKKI